MSCSLLLVDLKWTHIHSVTKTRWWPRLIIEDGCRLRRHPNGYFVSDPECWSLNGGVLRNLSHRWLYGLSCVSEGYDNLWYICDKGVWSSGTRLITWSTDFTHFVSMWYRGGSDLMISRACLALPYAYDHFTCQSLFPARYFEAPM